jgi:N-acetylglucosaminyl-diphospho-decaprenol L-rhamnosyltransferase
MITVSIVSHGHGNMTSQLLQRLLTFPEVSKVVLICNIPESIIETSNNRVLLLNNPVPKGFGANHNTAFSYCTTEYFCVLNPDIELLKNPFLFLTAAMQSQPSEIAAPLVLTPKGMIEDSVRYFPTLGMLIMKLLGGVDGRYKFNQGQPPFEPDWVAGMFMLFRSNAYMQLHGFDENYFLYYEDVDICRRAKLMGLKIVFCPEVAVVHHAQRASRKNIRHMRWHIASMFRYLSKSA